MPKKKLLSALTPLTALLLSLSLLFSLSACRLPEAGTDHGTSDSISDSVSNSTSDSTSGSTSAGETVETPVKEGAAEASLRALVLSSLDELEKSGVTDVLGNPVENFSDYRALLSGGGFRPSKLLYAELLYRSYYVGTYQELNSLLPDIVKNLLSLYDAEKLTNGSDITDAMMHCYYYTLGDQYGNYFSVEDFGDYNDDLTASYVGIGVQVILLQSGYMEVIRVYSGTPALEQGLREGDIVVAVEGEDVAELGYYPTIAKIKGEEGTYVTITVLRGDERIDFTLRRARLTEYTVEGTLLTENGYPTVGYLRINEFDDGTFRQFIDTYTRLKAEGAASFVFDVRANPGGKLEAIVAVLEYILPNGPIAKMNYKNPADDFTISSVFDVLNETHSLYQSYRAIYNELGSSDHVVTEPFTVLVNAHTASAGELFSSAIRDYANRGEIIAHLFGVNTYGKGMGQSSFPLGVLDETGTYFTQDGTYLNVSTFYYDPPYGPNYEGIGVEPHVTVELSEEAQNKSVLKLTFEEDSQLQAALSWLAER